MAACRHPFVQLQAIELGPHLICSILDSIVAHAAARPYLMQKHLSTSNSQPAKDVVPFAPEERCYMHAMSNPMFLTFALILVLSATGALAQDYEYRDNHLVGSEFDKRYGDGSIGSRTNHSDAGVSFTLIIPSVL